MKQQIKWYAAASTRNEEEYYRVTDKCTHQRIATVHGTQDEQRTLACLIAAAPELAYAVSEVIASVRHLDSTHCKLDYDTLELLKETLAKSKGKL